MWSDTKRLGSACGPTNVRLACDLVFAEYRLSLIAVAASTCKGKVLNMPSKAARCTSWSFMVYDNQGLYLSLWMMGYSTSRDDIVMVA